MTFYKKDLKEIQSSLSGLESKGGDDFAKKALEAVEKHFIEQWQRSYDLITPCRLSRVTGGAKMFQIARVENGSKNGEIKHAIN
jgi:hypothetical protein